MDADGDGLSVSSGCGSTCVAAAQLGRLWIGVDTDPTYVALARRRISAEASPHLF